jgi:hypothetical protein
MKVPIDGREFKLAVHIFRPNGTGPFPLVVINHGTPVSIADARKHDPVATFLTDVQKLPSAER